MFPETLPRGVLSRSPDEMPEPSEFSPFNVEEQQLYSQVPLDDIENGSIGGCPLSTKRRRSRSTSREHERRRRDRSRSRDRDRERRRSRSRSPHRRRSRSPPRRHRSSSLSPVRQKERRDDEGKDKPGKAVQISGIAIINICSVLWKPGAELINCLFFLLLLQLRIWKAKQKRKLR
ncbi:hypothetical protein ILYODFUR_021112 [Ilyodon furcidens]|uniref:Uncharacterized protein n=1 Tax=Ilyodon furcidens TaxID=33524 RepID=A0ABV0UK45_9TELE